MTIIVALKGVGMCSDTLCTYESGDLNHQAKIYRHENDLIGLAGDSDDCWRYWYWYSANADPKRKPKFREGFEGLLLRGNQLFTISESCFVSELQDEYYACGCGFPYAMAVMSGVKKPTKATMVKAVKAACKLNAWCGVDSKGVRFEPV